MAVDWTAVGALATGGGAVVAAASAVVVAWQAKETRRAAQAAVESVALGRSALVVSQTATIESTKTRLDARAPRIRVIPKGIGSENVFIYRDDKWVEWVDVQDVLRRTRDDATRIRIAADFEVVNEGVTSVYVRLVGRYIPVGQEYRSAAGDGGRVVLAPGKVMLRGLQGEATLERWSKQWSGPGSDAKPLTVRATLICADMYDDGIVDKWGLELIGRPVESVPDDLSAWRLRDVWDTPDQVEAVAAHQERTYFASKIRREKLSPAEVMTGPSDPNGENAIPAKVSVRLIKQNNKVN